MTEAGPKYEVGSHVEWSLGKDEGGNDEAVAIGIVGKLEMQDENIIAYVVEVHAFHRLWGGSNADRGKVFEVKYEDLETVSPSWKHIIHEHKDKDVIRNVLDELMAPATP